MVVTYLSAALSQPRSLTIRARLSSSQLQLLFASPRWRTVNPTCFPATTWTLFRDTQLGLDFTAINFYDGQGFMVDKALGVSNALELKGATVCVLTGTTTELNLTDFSRSNSLISSRLSSKIPTFVTIHLPKVAAMRSPTINPAWHPPARNSRIHPNISCFRKPFPRSRLDRSYARTIPSGWISSGGLSLL